MNYKLLILFSIIQIATCSPVWSKIPIWGKIWPGSEGGSGAVLGGSHPDFRSLSSTYDVLYSNIYHMPGYLPSFNLPGKDHQYFNGTYRLNLNTGEVTELVTTGVDREGRAFSRCVNYKDTMICYGGIRYNNNFSLFKIYGDMHQFNPVNNSWSLISLNNGPGKRTGHGLGVYGDYVYLFAGLDQFGVSHNDMWKYHVPTNTWTKVMDDTTDGLTAPWRRFNFAFRYSDYLNAFILSNGDFSGQDENNSSLGFDPTDIWSFSLDTETWTLLKSDALRHTTQGMFYTWESKVIFSHGDISHDPSTFPLRCENYDTGYGDTSVKDTFVFKLNNNNGYRRVNFDNNNVTPIKGATDYQIDRFGFWLSGHYFGCSEPGDGQAYMNQALWMIDLAEF